MLLGGFWGGSSETYGADLSKLGATIMKLVPGLRSDQDAIRYVMPMLPKPTETKEAAERKAKQFDAWLESQRPASPLLKNAGMNTKTDTASKIMFPNDPEKQKRYEEWKAKKQ